MNAVVAAVLVMLILATLRVHVVLSLFLGAVVGGLLSGIGLEATMVAFQEGLAGGARIALSYALLGAFAMAVAHSGLTQLLADVASVLIAVRGAKSKAKVSMKTSIRKAVFLGEQAALERLKSIEADLRAVGHITGEVVWRIAEGPLTVEVELEEPPAA